MDVGKDRIGLVAGIAGLAVGVFCMEVAHKVIQDAAPDVADALLVRVLRIAFGLGCAWIVRIVILAWVTAKKEPKPDVEDR